MKRTNTATKPRPVAIIEAPDRRPVEVPRVDAGADAARRVLRSRLEVLRDLHVNSTRTVRGTYVSGLGAHVMWSDAPPEIDATHVNVCVEALRSLVSAVVPRRYVAAVLSRESLAWHVPLDVVPYWSPGPCMCPEHHEGREHAAPALVALGLDSIHANITHAQFDRIPTPMRYGFAETSDGRGLFVPSSHARLLHLDDIDRELDAMMRAAPSPEARGAWNIKRTTPEEVHRAFEAIDAGGAPGFAVDRAIEVSREHARATAQWNGLALAHVAYALRSVRAEQRSARFFALPASQVARVPFEVMARGETFANAELRRLPLGGFRVAWDGKPRGEQITLGLALNDVPHQKLFREIMRELKAEGLRDYVILHRLASEQGRTGRFCWTWEAHKRATAHDRRVSAGNTRDDEAREAVVKIILRLASAELHAEVERDGRRAWRVVGSAPLVYVAGGIEHGGRIEGLTLALNPALYDGAVADGERYFTQLPEAVLRLPSLPFCLAVMLAFRWRYARDKGGAVELEADELHAYMDAARWRAKHQASATETLHRALDAIAAAMGDGCQWEALDGGRYRVTASRAWIDAVVHEVPPELSPTTTNAPRNGGELVAWREARELSQREAAAVLGIGVATVKRAEADHAAPLPRSFRGVDWSKRPAPAELATRNPPIEGGDAQGDDEGD